MAVSIHPTAIVSPGAKLGQDVTVGPYCCIGEHVVLGDRCKVGPSAVIDGYTTIGAETEIFPFASVGMPPQDLKFRGEPSTLVIGEHNTIREYVTLQPGTAHGTMTTTIGSNNLFMVCSHVAHDCRVGNYNVFANSVALAGHVQVGDHIIVGGLVGIHQFCRIGDYALLSGGAMVAMDVPPYCIGQGDRCHLRGINVIGLQRAGFSPDEIRGIRKAYRHFFRSAGSLENKVQSLPADLSAITPVQRLLAFIQSSDRGVTTAARASSSDQ